MKKKLSNIFEIPLTDIAGDDKLTDFSIGGCPEKLLDSVKEIGIRNPITVFASGTHYKIVSGHKRFQAAPRSGLKMIPVNIVPKMDNATRLAINLNENFGHQHYSDTEKGCILKKLSKAGFSEEVIIENYMPLLELPRSKKIFQDLSYVETFNTKLKKLLHRSGVPVKTFSIFYKWDQECQDLVTNLLSILKPGANKWKNLLELLDEIATRENTSPTKILLHENIQNILIAPGLTAPQKYDRLHQTLYALRYPVFSDMKKQVAHALDEMNLDEKTHLKFQETFENDELKLEMKFRTEKELSNQVEKIFQALQSGSVKKLLKLF